MPQSQQIHCRARRTAVLAAAVLCPLLGLAGCGGDDLTRTFGLVRDAPDEFQVTTRAPLSMPPNFQLRPPRPGATRPQEQSTSAAAEATLVPQAALGSGQGAPSAGQQALLAASGPAAPTDIRRRVESEASLDEPDQSLTERLMFWRPVPQPGVVVDPTREAQRLRQNAALGRSIEQGDTPIIQRGTARGKGFLGLF